MYRLFDEEIFWESEGEESCYSQQKKWNSKSEFCFHGSLEGKQVDMNHLLEEKKKKCEARKGKKLRWDFFAENWFGNFTVWKKKVNLSVMFQGKRFIRLFLAEKRNFDKIWLQQRKSFEAKHFFVDFLAEKPIWTRVNFDKKEKVLRLDIFQFIS